MNGENHETLNIDLSNDSGNIESTLQQFLVQSTDQLSHNDTHHQFSHQDDIEKAIETAIINMDSNDLSVSDSLSTKHLSLESLLEDNHNTHLLFNFDEVSGGDNDSVTYQTLSNDRVKRTLQLDGEELDHVKKAKKVQGTNKSDEPFLSPASLSPSSLASDGSDVSLKIDTNQSLTTSIASIPLTKQKSKPKLTNNKSITTIQSSTGDNTTTNVRQKIFQEIPIPEKLTNEYTMQQVSEMKKRIINIHKLILNFNFLKDGYARTCIELKKTVNCLKDSELHRAHLLLENEKLKRKLSELNKQANSS
ncbi:hypothetical protein KAFR_0B06140 [Kazachstania africana CBS 2517]|uniref:Protein ATC1/LIC4 n=1 Tax=Kazachstania africana (strain ATCC 22294 / BCRC 22015 / CBS 2517 / CECT 1963 / NBRC 1671 / NRRL Y-8276) TaxID=1071382 RepID=H2ARB0_KAZAF|nr:hypothetical protein KAFR_0B06140 [Kazachstania africana CBS 2517]CCF56910.1 hypothetical protein KAFR_0B06140 [Kazachstania africana CBS 2517]